MKETTTLDLQNVSPSEERDPSVEQIPDNLFSSNVPTVQLKLSLKDGTFIGYVGLTEKGWCKISDTPVNLAKNIIKNQTYYQFVDINSKFNSRWMTAQKVAGRHPVGAYRAYLRTSWTYKNNRLISNAVNQPLSFLSQETGQLYANDGKNFTVLNVKEISV